MDIINIGSGYACKLCGEIFSNLNVLTKHLNTEHTYYCEHCGVVGNRIEIINHRWKQHKSCEINAAIKRLDLFLKNISKGFLIRYHIPTELDDLIQYMRISVEKVLREKYDPAKNNHPIVGDPSSDRFAKSCCSIFLKRFLQQHYFKRNIVNINLSPIDDNTFSNPPIIDIRHDYDVIVDEIRRSLCDEELEIFEYLIDESEMFTQAKIADILGVSQPMISYKVKAIREKTLKILDRIYK